MAPHLEWRPHSNCRINSLDGFIWRTIRAKKISLALRLEWPPLLQYWMRWCILEAMSFFGCGKGLRVLAFAVQSRSTVYVIFLWYFKWSRYNKFTADELGNRIEIHVNDTSALHCKMQEPLWTNHRVVPCVKNLTQSQECKLTCHRL